MWDLDLAFADIISTSTDPRLGAIRLAWWRERLDDLDQSAPAPTEPRLQGIVAELLTRGISGSQVSLLEDGWLPLLAPFPWGAEQADGLRQRGRILFGIGAQLLGGEADQAAAAGALWSVVDGALHCSDARSREFLLAEARAEIARVPHKMPRRVRPLTILAALAANDALETKRPRGNIALAHRLFGTIPR